MKPIDLDQILTAQQCARWLGLTQYQFDKQSRLGVIPTQRIGQRTRRYHPRTVLAKLNKEIK